MNLQERLLEALQQEQSIFRNFSNWHALSQNTTAFYAPDTDLVPHWNLVYPSRIDYRYSENDLENIRSFYGGFGRIPHVMTFFENEVSAVERVCYFVLDRSGFALSANENPERDNFFVARSGVNLSDFARVVGDVFELDTATHDFFLDKMIVMSRLNGSKFWIVYSGENPVGTASTFLTENGGQFLFNVAISKDVQRRGLGKSMLATVVRESLTPLYTYSHNPAMIEGILPALGFTNVGHANVVPVDALIQNRNSGG